MSRLELEAFSDAHLEDAAALLAARHTRDRKAEPLLPKRYEASAEARALLEEAWRADGASGSAALRDGRLSGYMIGAPRDTEVWGENVWIEHAGHAAEQAEDARDLYGHAAARWVDEGRTRHYVLVSAEPELVGAWFRVGFGQQQAHGYREIPERTEVELPDGYEIRPPAEAEVEQLLELDFALPKHQQASPVFSSRPLPKVEEIRREWADTLARGDEHVLIGWRDGTPVACWSVCGAGHSSHHRGLGLPESACYLAYAVTLPESRGSGIGVALTQAELAWAAEQGYRAMVTDWRVTNLLASRFWPKRGFRPSLLGLYRSIP
jgi:ribosomal protein S18 acetylase RimI-like enzyme